MRVSADVHQLCIAGMACGKTAFKQEFLIWCLNSVGRQFLHGHSQLKKNPNHFSETLLHHA